MLSRLALISHGCVNCETGHVIPQLLKTGQRPSRYYQHYRGNIRTVTASGCDQILSEVGDVLMNRRTTNPVGDSAFPSFWA